MQGRADTCMAGLVAVLDRGGTAGTTAAPPWCGRLDISWISSMYPVRRSVCNLAGDAALLEDEAAHKLLVDAHMRTRTTESGRPCAHQPPQAVRRRLRARRRPPWRNTLKMNVLSRFHP